MNSHQTKFLALAMIAILVACGWLLVGSVPHPRGPDSLLGMLFIAAVLGTMFGQVSLAAAWSALGPYALIRRLPLSFAWIAAIVLSFGCNIAQGSNSNGLAVLLVYAAALVGQWLLVQAPMWLLITRYGLRIVSAEHQPTTREQSDQQFGIRQIMILTALVAIVLGAGRFLLGGLKADQSFRDWRGVLLFGLLALSNAAIAFPLIAATLRRRNPLPAILGALLLVALATVAELSVVSWLWPSGKPSAHDYWIIALINAFQCPWILTVLLLLRAGGFRLISRDAALPASSAGKSTRPLNSTDIPKTVKDSSA
jgi:hypothetical protein